jgi:hypothetical protein
MSLSAESDSQAAWHSARTLRDLGQLTGRWLEGRLADIPGYAASPAAETLPLVPVLAVVNRAGYVTNGSQPGTAGPGFDGARWEQRAAVEGFADPALTARIVDAAWRNGLAVIAHDPARLPRWRFGHDRELPVTRRNGEVVTWFGAHLPRRDLRDDWTGYRICHPDAIAALCGAWQVTVIDPQWGRSGLLWRVLGALEVA